MNSSQTCPHDIVKNFINDYLNRVIDLLGVISNGLCILVFSRILTCTQQSSQLNNNNMFKYLLMKSIMDFMNSLSNFFLFWHNCSNDCESSKSFIVQIWHIWFYDYIEYILETLSSLFEIAATFDCYITINNKYEFCQSSLFFYSFSILVTIFWTIFYLIFPLGLVIKDKIEINPFNNETKHIYSVEDNDFANSQFYKKISIIDSLIRDGLFFIILIIINVKIFIILKRMSRQRQALTISDNLSILFRNAEKAKRKKMQMIFAIGVNYSIGHFSFLIYNALYGFNFSLVSCFFVYFVLPYYITYTNNIFFYYFYNKIFKKFFVSLIPFFKPNI
jgi:hypothetical protein